MKHKLVFIALFVVVFCKSSKAQTTKADSLQLAKTLNELVLICRRVDFADPKVSQLGIFYKAAPYIVYRGDDKKRAWKVFADYTNTDEKNGVNEVCYKINQTANQDSTGYKIVKYITEKESEGTWHILLVTYKKKNVEKTTAYAFLKIDNKFGLGDID